MRSDPTRLIRRFNSFPHRIITLPFQKFTKKHAQYGSFHVFSKKILQNDAKILNLVYCLWTSTGAGRASLPTRLPSPDPPTTVAVLFWWCFVWYILHEQQFMWYICSFLELYAKLNSTKLMIYACEPDMGRQPRNHNQFISHVSHQLFPLIPNHHELMIYGCELDIK